MSFLETAKKRYSCRKFLPKPVEPEKLAALLEAARIAPTGANKQPFKLLVLQEAAGLEKLKKAANIYGAPLAIVVCGDHRNVWVRPFDQKDIVDIDTSIVTDHMMLQATELGLDSVWICYFNPTVLREEFQIPADYEAISILALGYSAQEALSPDRHDTARKPLEELVCYEEFK
ncbi:nitroreductase [Heliobacterium gestii]|uniref:Nitroreductase n=1 Tax=Heliomicrobium gestii TaxID=2699 RepID=A0A845L725_HELGE|nr:nitroreductase family protein [Heliomicrobium gestii]MBM7865782.1 nitroreductase [Heliomicrobium gestii]MZP42028.1 nitroreductase [Heliomicrobium gestii]